MFAGIGARAFLSCHPELVSGSFLYYYLNMSKQAYVYVVGNNKPVLYIGVTTDLQRRIYEHKNGLIEGFSKKYKCKKLLYYEVFEDINEAIAREKQLKNWHREWKLNLIKGANPKFKDLGESFS